MVRRRASGAPAVRLRHELARGGAHRHRAGQRHPRRALHLHPPPPARARSGDRTVHRIPGGRQRQHRARPGPLRGAQAAGGFVQRIRARAHGGDHGRGGRALPSAGAHRRPPRRHVARARRDGQPRGRGERLREGRPGARGALPREREGHRHPQRERQGGGGGDGSRRRRARVRRLRVRGMRGRPVVAPSGTHGRGDHPAARLRALLRPYREAPGPAARPAGAARPGQVRVLPRGRRQPARGRIRAGRAPDPPRRDPRGLLLRRAPRPYGRAAHARPRRRHGAGAPAAGGRLAQLLLRPGELHPRRPVPRGRVPGARGLLRRLRAELRGHRHLRRHRQGLRGVDGQGPSAAGPHRQRPAPHLRLPGRAGVHRGPGVGDPGAALRPPLPLPPVHERARRAALPGARTPCGAWGLLRGGGGLGAAQLVRPRGGRAPLRVLLRPPELVRTLRRRAPRGARGGGPVRPVQLLEVPRQGPRRLPGAATHLQQRRRRRARTAGVHALAERARGDRGGADRDPARRRTSSWW